MKNSEVFWEAACDIGEYTRVPEYAVMSVCNSIETTYLPFHEMIREAGYEFVPRSPIEVSFDFLHFMSLKAEDDEKTNELLEMIDASNAAPMIPINKLSDVQLGDNRSRRPEDDEAFEGMDQDAP